MVSTLYEYLDRRKKDWKSEYGISAPTTPRSLSFCLNKPSGSSNRFIEWPLLSKLDIKNVIHGLIIWGLSAICESDPLPQSLSSIDPLQSGRVHVPDILCA